MSIEVGISLVIALFVTAALLAARAGIRSIQSARKVSFFRVRRAHMLAGWKWLLLALVLFSVSVASALVGEPVANQLFPPTPVPTATPTRTPLPTETLPASATATRTPTATLTLEFSLTPTETPTASLTATPSQTPSPTSTATQTATLTSTGTPSRTPTATRTLTPTRTATASRTPTRTPSPTQNTGATSTEAARISQTERAIAVLSLTPTRTATASPTGTMSPTPTATRTPSPTFTATFSPTSTSTPTALPTETVSPTPTPTDTSTATRTPTPTPLLTLTPTSTPLPTGTATISPTATMSQTPSPTRTPTPDRTCDRIEVVADVNVPTYSTFAPGATFTKIWRLRNIGTCTWNTSYRAVLLDGDLIGGRNFLPLPTEVAPGETIDLAMNLTAPRLEGFYRGDWLLRNDEGEVFDMASTANRPFSVAIRVKTPPPSGTIYDFVATGCSAQWSSGAGTLTCPSSTRDNNGYVARQSLSRLENGRILVIPSLLTVPQNTLSGYIRGVYPPFRVQTGDRFQALVNCAAEATSCRVLFRLEYQVGAGPIQKLWEVDERFDGNAATVNLDLSDMAGQEVKFIMSTLSLGTASGDRALWVQPRITRTNPSVTLTPTP